MPDLGKHRAHRFLRTYCSCGSASPSASAHAHMQQKTAASVDLVSSQCICATALEVSQRTPDIETSDGSGVFKQPPDGEDVAVWALRISSGSVIRSIGKVSHIRCFHDVLNDIRTAKSVREVFLIAKHVPVK